MISKGPGRETERGIDLLRCERIAWPRKIIDLVNLKDDKVVSWCNKRKEKRRQLLALSDFGYLVVLEMRSTYFLLWTAYCINEGYERTKKKNEYLNSGA